MSSGTVKPRAYAGFLLCGPLAAALLAAHALPASDNATLTLVDETGRTVTVPQPVRRVITLAPSLTEIVYALGAEDRLVGVTDESDFPPAARQKPRVGGVLRPNMEAIVELKPDLVLGSRVDNLGGTVKAIERLNVPLYGVDPRSVEAVLRSIRNVARLLGVPERGRALADRLETQLAGLQLRIAGTARPKPRLLFVVWAEPLIVVGGNTFLHDALEKAGGESVSAQLSGDWPRLSLEQVVQLDPDVLILPRAHGGDTTFAGLENKHPWRRLRAIRENRVIWIDSAIERPGPRIVDMIGELALALYPELRAARVSQ